ncbi:alpha/beta hydrolase [Nocardiopsis trehalosi]|uniref:alpha/beta hydrolase n=1 Tax=Nocardiopsis trehalosi TaxID=109329 RepID=UPI00082D4BDC|nr:alpha/beta fold hydrolase [Nocardiopsis trehalosi]
MPRPPVRLFHSRRPGATAALPLAVTTALTTVLVPLAATAAAAEEPSAAAGGRLDWGDCPEGDYGAGMECAELRVPVDHADPRGRHITLTLGRLPHTEEGRAEGSVLVNPGGPMGFGIEYLGTLGAPFAGLREHMDVVTWDLRGDPGGFGGFSTPIDCEWDYVRSPALPADQAAFDDLAAANRETADACRAADPELFDHMGSADHARDLEAVRRALGERRLNLHMTSYGGTIGQTYARLFPERVRTLYLDGVADHTEAGDAVYEGFAADGDEAFGRFTDWCAEDASCALHGRDVPALWRELIDAADSEPIPAPVADVDYTGRDIQHAAVGVLFRSTPGPEWAGVAQAIADGLEGDASGFVTDPERPFAGFPMPGVVECLDWEYPADHAEAAATAERIEEAAPLTGGRLQMYGNILSCAGWPTPVSNPPGPLPAEVPPMLGAGSWSDGGSTARAVDAVEGGVTIRRDGPGHGLYWMGDACVIAHADHYLRTTELPPADTIC